MRRLYKVFHFVLFAGLATLCLSACSGSGPWGSTASPRTAEQPPSTLSNTGQLQTMPQIPGAVPGTPGSEAQIPLQAAANIRPVKVGILLPLSGPHAALGQAMLNAAQMSVFDVGHESFELIPRDTQGTSAGAYTAAQAVVAEGAELVLGPLFAEEVKAAKPVTANARINMIAFSTDWTLAGGNTYIMGFLPFDQIQRITSYASARQSGPVAVIAPNTQYGRAVVSAFQNMAPRVGLNTSAVVQFPAQTANLTPVIRDFSQYDRRVLNGAPSMAPQPFNAVLMPVGGDMAVTISTLLTQFDMPPSKVRRLGTGLFDDAALASSPAIEGAWFAAPSPRLRENFERRYQENFGALPPRLATLAYDSAALAAVLAQRGLMQGNRPAFDTASITNPNGFAGIDGIFRFRSNGTAERGLAVLEFKAGRTVIIDDAPKTFQESITY